MLGMMGLGWFWRCGDEGWMVWGAGRYRPRLCKKVFERDKYSKPDRKSLYDVMSVTGITP